MDFLQKLIPMILSRFHKNKQTKKLCPVAHEKQTDTSKTIITASPINSGEKIIPLSTVTLVSMSESRRFGPLNPKIIS